MKKVLALLFLLTSPGLGRATPVELTEDWQLTPRFYSDTLKKGVFQVVTSETRLMNLAECTLVGPTTAVHKEVLETLGDCELISPEWGAYSESEVQRFNAAFDKKVHERIDPLVFRTNAVANLSMASNSNIMGLLFAVDAPNYALINTNTIAKNPRLEQHFSRERYIRLAYETFRDSVVETAKELLKTPETLISNLPEGKQNL